ncbi:MAG: hypothetical protein NTZ97_04970 [Candidatus Moranbacteria bacterium]|nr:hypothetical protein [Candidatus Moranbacteria bacterium]
MGDYLLNRWQKGASRLKGLKRTPKKHILLFSINILVSLGLFFYVSSGIDAYAEKTYLQRELTDEALDPLNRIGQGTVQKEDLAGAKDVCSPEKKEDPQNDTILSLVSGHPIEAMMPFISQQGQEVASFLVAIAKKESDWGKHVPTKNGRDCFNYWGYKGGYNLTRDGYSCFDSPEQAVNVVGERIANLVGKNINTPEKMLVWKCGSSCISHNQQDVRKWVADVDLYYNKLN